MFNKWNTKNWVVVYKKLYYQGIPLSLTSWDELVIQISYRDERIPEEDWPSENKDLNIEIFEEDQKSRLKDLGIVDDLYYSGYKKFLKFLPDKYESLNNYFSAPDLWLIYFDKVLENKIVEFKIDIFEKHPEYLISLWKKIEESK